MEKISKRAGFTLVELIIVIAIISILAAVAVPNYLNAVNKAKTSSDMGNLYVLNSVTETYRFIERIATDDVFNGISTDEARMQKLVEKNFLNNTIEPQATNATFIWNSPTQLWAYKVDEQVYLASYNIILTSSELNNTTKETYNSFIDYMSIWISQESIMPVVNASNGSLSWNSANYTGEYTTNQFQAKFWNEYFDYVGVPDFNSTNSSISDFKVFFTRDTSGNITPDVAGIYIQMGGTRSIYFSNGETVENQHYKNYVDSDLRELVYH